jgi:polyisoprenyl-phosphate glycosyltransferase
LFTDRAILGWTSTLGMLLLTAALLCIGFFVTGVLLLNQSQRSRPAKAEVNYRIIK